MRRNEENDVLNQLRRMVASTHFKASYVFRRTRQKEKASSTENRGCFPASFSDKKRESDSLDENECSYTWEEEKEHI